MASLEARPLVLAHCCSARPMVLLELWSMLQVYFNITTMGLVISIGVETITGDHS